MTLLGNWTDKDFDRAVRTGLFCGLAAALMYLAWSVLPLPSVLNRLFHVFFGVLLVPGFLAIGMRLQQSRPSVAALFGAILGMIAGPFFAAMTIVQMSNLRYMRRFIREAADPAAKAAFEQILRGVFTVQLGLDIVWDVFVTTGTILIAVAMIRGRGTLRYLGVVGLLAGGLTLVLNLWTMPVPPAEAGLFDAGPLTGAWYLIVSAWMLWRHTPAGQVAAAT